MIPNASRAPFIQRILNSVMLSLEFLSVQGSGEHVLFFKRNMSAIIYKLIQGNTPRLCTRRKSVHMGSYFGIHTEFHISPFANKKVSVIKVETILKSIRI